MSRIKWFVLGMALVAASQGYADEVTLVGQQGSESLAVPQPGMTKEAVSEQFGTPMDTKADVGNPPIGRWTYDNFTVYFEQQYVIHAVAHRKK